jgi:outer membrane receptor for ferrienterochelin and colicins
MKFVTSLLCMMVLYCHSPLTAFAAGGFIKGIVLDSLTERPVAGAVVKLEKTARGAYVNKTGEFSISSIPAGTYTVTTTLIGYFPSSITLVIGDNDTLDIEILLRSQEVRTRTVVVSASKHTQNVQDVPISISVVESKELEARNITKIDDALRYIPGVNMAKDQVNIRGSSGFALGLGSRVALLLDGFPMISGDNGDMKFDALPILAIDRIEVIKGAGSALYGTSALGGVISIFTASPSTTPEYKVRTYGGIYTQPRYTGWQVFSSPPENYGIDLSYKQKFGNLGVVVAGGTRFDRTYRLFDDTKKWNLYSKLSYDLSPRTSVTGFVNYAAENHANWVYWNSLDSATRPPTGTNFNERLLSDKLAAALEFKQFFTDKVYLVVRSGIFATDFHNEGLAQGVTAINSKATAFNTEAQLSAKINRAFFLTTGINATRNSVESPVYGSPVQTIYSAYAQAEYSGIDRLILTFGSRYDVEKTDSSAGNNQFNPKLGLSYSSDFGVQFRSSLGRGFRAPMAGERFAAIRFQGITVVPNLQLIPEESWSFEGGLKYDFDLLSSPGSLDIAYFQNELYQLVEPQFTLDGKIKFENITRARVQGIECTFRSLIMNAVGFETSITAMSPREYSRGLTLPFRSSILWYNKVLLPITKGLELQADYRFISRVERIDDRITALNVVEDADARVAMHVVDARAIIKLKDLFDIPLRCTFNINNALDYYYVEILGNLAPTRSLSLQIEAVL